MTVIRPPKWAKPSNSDVAARFLDLRHIARRCDKGWGGNISKEYKPWMTGRVIAHKLIGHWAIHNPNRWVFWPGASPQVKDWNHTHPPIRSMQLDLGLSDEQTNYLFRNPKIKTYHDLANALSKVHEQIRSSKKKLKS